MFTWNILKQSPMDREHGMIQKICHDFFSICFSSQKYSKIIPQAFWRSTMKSWNLWFIVLPPPPAHQHIQPIHSFLLVTRRCHLAQSHERAPHRDPHPCRWSRNVGCLTALQLGVQHQFQNGFVNLCGNWISFSKCSLNFGIPGFKQRTYRSHIDT